MSDRTTFTPMRYLKRHHIPWICLAVIALVMYGCSFIYVIQVDGRVVSGIDQAPIAGAIITVGSGSAKGSICTSDREGRWQFKTRTAKPQLDREGNQTVMSLPLQIEAHGTTFRLDPKIPVPDRGRNINGFVLTALDLGTTN